MKNMFNNIPNLIPNYCDKCGAKHLPEDLEIVEQNNTKVVCKLSCASCNNSYLIHINNNGGVKRSSYKSEMSKKEVKKFSHSDEISSNEILDVYNSLKKINSIEDLNYLLGKSANN